ncbi:c-type cytochrome [Azospirillum sp.]|uniref:c-type cytochrome n=1 Tax=Azospirillum sp. TaxID=34012 RepID=UPI003D70D496
MSKFSKLLALALLASAPALAAEPFPGVGRPATPAEVKAWDIDVGPDFAGLPKGSGSVERGMGVWEDKCASCHGTFAESNSVFTPLVGGTTVEDVKTGHVANLKRPDFPQRTTFMKVATVSTLFDYIRRAMPWNAPKSLSDDEVYAVLAYLLNLAEVVPDDFVLDDQSIRAVQERLPNRNGMTTAHALWPGVGLGTERNRPDTANTGCMADCKKAVEQVSALPDYAWNAHGNLAQQNRRIGGVRGKQTGPEEAETEAGAPALRLAERQGCLSCHGVSSRIVGPSYAEVAAKYRGRDSAAALVEKVKAGGEGVWGSVAMPAQPELKDEEAKALVEWILAGAPEK